MSFSDQPILRTPLQSLSIVSTNMEREPSSPGSMSRLTFTSGRESGTEKTISSLGVLAILSMLQSIVAIVLLVRLDFKQEDYRNITNNVIVIDQSLYDSMLDSGMVLSSFTIVLNFCCVVACTIQSYFAAKMLKLPQGEERACRFLSNTSGLRFIVISSFFASIPVFLSALCLYLLIEFRFVPAIVSTAFIGIGIIFTIFSFSQSVHLWRRERTRVSEGNDSFEPTNPSPPVSSGNGMSGSKYFVNGVVDEKPTLHYTNDVENGDIHNSSNLSTLV